MMFVSGFFQYLSGSLGPLEVMGMKQFMSKFGIWLTEELLIYLENFRIVVRLTDW